ncbi:ATP-binding protein [Azospirillum sp. TSO22-1]|uniref:ATP-binding protein n=1 Tax=Azospirillum sp. TSO22-1 TaxID=716789 RepID=UPI0011B73E99|nr:ATP-binding protein [Azospirillum sp. TSO22-1]
MSSPPPRPLPPPAPPLRVRRRMGIAARITLGVAIMGVLVVLTGVVSLTAFRQFRGEVAALSNEALPRVITSAELLTDFHGVVAQISSLAAASTEAQRKAASDKLSGELDYMQILVRRLRENLAAAPGAAEAGTPVLEQLRTSLSVLDGTVTDLDSEVSRTITAARRLAAATQELAGFAAGLERFAEGDDAARAGAWSVRMAALVARGARAADLDHLNRLTVERRDIESAIGWLGRPDDAVSGPLPQAMDGAEAELARVLLGPDGVFEVAAERLRSRNRAQALYTQARNLVEAVDRAVQALHHRTQTEADARAHDLALLTGTQSTLVMALVAASFLLVVGVFFFFRSSVSSRLLALNGAVLARLAGEPTRIPVRGEDEIADIGQSIRFFIDEIDRRQHDLAANERRFRDLVEGSIQGILILREFVPLYANDAFARIVGMSVGEVLALPTLIAFFGPEEAERTRAAYDRIIATGESPPTRRLQGRRRDGAEVWVELSGRRVNWMGEPAVQAVVVDVTREVEAEAALARASAELGAAVAAMPSGLLLLDGGFAIRICNDRLLAILGYPADLGRPGRPFAELFAYEVATGRMTPAEGAASRAGTEARLRSGQPLVAERTLPDGTTVLIQGNRQPGGEGGGYVLTVTDITEQQRTRDELRQSKEAAERALDDLTLAQKSLIQAEKMASLGQLVAGVAHEVNTPVGVTLTAATQLQIEVDEIAAHHGAGRLKRSAFEEFLSTSRELSHLIATNSERAADLIQSFKLVAIDQSSGERRRFVLADYIEELLRSLSPALRQAGCTVMVDCPPDLEVDGYPGALSQILTNLVMNVLTHAYAPGAAGRIRVTVRPAPNDHVVLDFADGGRGIPPDVLPKIFDPFYTTTRGTGGSGLGLHIVYNLVVGTLRGSIAAASEPGQGTCFTLSFPRVTPKPAVADLEVEGVAD